ncbi:hypothetical protein F971_01975 [Acinetobacter vivianii]|uniref:Uncharacterized protein n=1 Tax=Acinetobacter vivianii TaxID=1776742 RepID=N8W5K3_9GAMM|nr:hypothetical protein [Acinetobacter vivianii]ENU92088.1 hypothetical protein F971_01975 [Acinetobacter vivianii]
MTKPTLQELVAKTEYFTIGQESEHDLPKRIVCAVTLLSGLPIMGEYNVPEGSIGEDYNQYAFDNAVQNMKNAGIDFEELRVIEPEVIPKEVDQTPTLGEAHVIDGACSLKPNTGEYGLSHGDMFDGIHSAGGGEGNPIRSVNVDTNGLVSGYGLNRDYISGTIQTATNVGCNLIPAIEALTTLLKVPKLKPNVAEAACNKLVNLIGQLGQTESPSSEVTKQVEMNSQVIKILDNKIEFIHTQLQGLENQMSFDRS